MCRLRFISFTLLFSLAFASCSKDVADDKLPSEPVVLHATYAGGKATKTEFGIFNTSRSYAQILWSKGDNIAVFGSADTQSCRYETQEGGAEADFVPGEGASEASGSSFMGLYPYTESATCSFGSKTIETEIPIDQFAVAGTFDPIAYLAVGSSSSLGQMSFYNTCSGLCFTLKNPSAYSRIEFSGKNGEKLAGPVSISLSNSTEPEAEATSNVTSVFLNLAEGESFASDTEYFIVFCPGFFSKGFKVKFYSSSGSPVQTCECSAGVTFRRGAFGRVNNIDDPAKLSAIREGTDLAYGNNVANCYIVSEAGSYKFPMVKGNDPDQALEGVTSVAVLWETVNTSSAPAKGSIIKDNITFNGRYIYFDTPSSLKSGNALVAAYSGSEIVWSWHIWVLPGYDADDSAQTIVGKSKPMMDRNLGALKAEPSTSDALCNGLMYQWGRKDPFPGAAQSYVSASTGGTLIATTGGAFKTAYTDTNTDVAYSIANPTVFFKCDRYWTNSPDGSLWGTEKTIYDPCPYGWKVPTAYKMQNYVHVVAEEAWNVSSTDYQRVSGSLYGMYFNLASGSSRAWYPNGGYLSLGGSLYMVGQYTCYWSCNIIGDNSYAMEMSQTVAGALTFTPYRGGKARGEGNYVRCIKE